MRYHDTFAFFFVLELTASALTRMTTDAVDRLGLGLGGWGGTYVASRFPTGFLSRASVRVQDLEALIVLCVPRASAV